jgi:hypothetical protein
VSYITTVKVGKHTYLYEATAYRDENGKPRNKKHPIGKIDPLTGERIYKPEYLARMARAGTPVATSEATEERSMGEEISKLLLSYIDWMREQYNVSFIDNVSVITTPFLNRHNDHIRIYVSKDLYEKFTLTDGGDTLGDLKASGWEPNTEKGKQLLRQVLHGVGVELLEGDVIGTSTNQDDFSRKMHNLIQAILTVHNLCHIYYETELK